MLFSAIYVYTKTSFPVALVLKGLGVIEVVKFSIFTSPKLNQLLRFQVEAHGKFTRKRQSEKITKRVWFLPRLGPADGCWLGKEHPERLPEAVWDWKVRLKN